jgi:hypothetical protein
MKQRILIKYNIGPKEGSSEKVNENVFCWERLIKSLTFQWGRHRSLIEQRLLDTDTGK